MSTVSNVTCPCSSFKEHLVLIIYLKMLRDLREIELPLETNREPFEMGAFKCIVNIIYALNGIVRSAPS